MQFAGSSSARVHRAAGIPALLIPVVCPVRSQPLLMLVECGMCRSSLTIAVLLFTLLSSPDSRAAEKCRLQQLVEVPITMDGRRPTIDAAINGQPATLLLDSGAFWSFLPASTAVQ